MSLSSKINFLGKKKIVWSPMYIYLGEFKEGFPEEHSTSSSSNTSFNINIFYNLLISQ